MIWIITTKAQVFRRYEIKAATRAEAEHITCWEDVGYVVEEEDIAEDFYSLEPKPERAA
jgi:hypothetical protein